MIVLQTANEIKTYVFKYCTQNDNIQQNEMVDLLNEVMDEEFDTICEDNSTNGRSKSSFRLRAFKAVFFFNSLFSHIPSFSELAEKLIVCLKLCIDGKFDEMKHYLSQLPQCVNWLDSNFKIVPVPKADDDSDSMSDSSDEEGMDMSSDDEAPTLADANQKIHNNTHRTDEDGWTTIPSKRR